MERTEHEWRVFATGLKKCVNGSKTIGAVNALETHSDGMLRELKKVSKPMYDHLIDHMGKRRVDIAKSTEKGSVK